MAKWGEGDPRWIVEERPDATNVNNWHWTERNASPWSQERIKELFKNFEISTSVAKINITEIDKCEGEASANNRKGKLIFFYEWNIVLKWKGKLLTGSGADHEGKITIPNLSEENDMSEIDVTIFFSIRIIFLNYFLIAFYVKYQLLNSLFFSVFVNTSIDMG